MTAWLGQHFALRFRRNLGSTCCHSRFALRFRRNLGSTCCCTPQRPAADAALPAVEHRHLAQLPPECCLEENDSTTHQAESAAAACRGAGTAVSTTARHASPASVWLENKKRSEVAIVFFEEAKLPTTEEGGDQAEDASIVDDDSKRERCLRHGRRFIQLLRLVGRSAEGVSTSPASALVGAEVDGAMLLRAGCCCFCRLSLVGGEHGERCVSLHRCRQQLPVQRALLFVRCSSVDDALLPVVVDADCQLLLRSMQNASCCLSLTETLETTLMIESGPRKWDCAADITVASQRE